MWMLGPIGFAAPALLLGLIALPILWLILRAVPPAPVRRRFPGVALLLGLADDEAQTDRTPWWLLLLRMVALAAVILGFAGPVLNPQPERAGDGPLLIVADGTWADARDWPARQDRIAALLDEAARAGRGVALVTLTDPPPAETEFRAADAAAQGLPALRPRPWDPDPAALADWAERLEGPFDTFWLSDGLARDSRAALLEAFETQGTVTVFQSPRPTFALHPARFEEGEVRLEASRTPTGPAAEVQVLAIGPDPAGIERQLATATIAFAPGEARAGTALSLPPELRNRVTRFELAGLRSAAAVTLADDALRRREVALVAGGDDREGLQLLSPLHYLEQALAPTADLIDGAMTDVLQANPDAIVLADVAAPPDPEALRDWVEAGGLLLRFAGPRVAASDLGRLEEDPLMPVRLRAGGRSVGGAMSWGEPKTLAPFPASSPFFGLPVPGDVTVSAQVMAQPDPTLADRVIAQLADGTPLVTRKALGEGQVVLFHVTANAEWSSLPLSGVFVQMLERLAVSTRPAAPGAEELAGTNWTAVELLDAHGALQEAGTMPGVPGERLAQVLEEGRPGPALPPGLYEGEDRRLAVNVIAPGTTLAPAAWPGRIAVEGLAVARETPLKGWLLGAALALLMADVLASLLLSGRLRGPRADAPAAIGLALPLALALAALVAAPGMTVQAAGAVTARTAAGEAHTAAGEAVTAGAAAGEGPGAAAEAGPRAGPGRAPVILAQAEGGGAAGGLPGGESGEATGDTTDDATGGGADGMPGAAPEGAEPRRDPAEEAFALEATREVVLGHVLTGDAQVDETAAAGLLGLSDTLYRRTSIEPAAPIGVDVETDELAFFPFLYWPVTAGQPIPSREAYAKLNRYLRSGGMILFDTRDADTAGFGSGSPEGRKLQALARPLDIPPLEPIPQDHVLTRTFYLLQDFPGRHASRDIWVEAAPPGAEQVEGMPFRNLNDGVTPVVIGGNDWAAAWAMDAAGNRLFPVGRGMAGEQQREIALRFGVNLIMHVLTGNYKSDQVHVPALLDRLGQ